MVICSLNGRIMHWIVKAFLLLQRLYWLQVSTKKRQTHLHTLEGIVSEESIVGLWDLGLHRATCTYLCIPVHTLYYQVDEYDLVRRISELYM